MMNDTPAHDAKSLVNVLRSRIRSTVDPLVKDAERLALVGFPYYSNVGDSVIWAGQIEYLRAVSGYRWPHYTCDVDTYNRTDLAGRVGGGTILLTGGGNLGDLWLRHHRLRKQVIKDFPENRIIQLPQTIHFQDPTELRRFKEVVHTHGGVELLVRDRRSLECADQQLDVPARLCPDMAFALGPLSAGQRPAEQDIVWLLRDDLEAPASVADSARHAVPAEDWLEEDETFAMRLRRVFERQSQERPWLFRRTLALRPRLEMQMARARLARGAAQLARGRVVVTNRLHGHIVATLLGVPQVLMDNSYGKVRSYYEEWTRNLGCVRWADSLDEAGSLAEEMAST